MGPGCIDNKWVVLYLLRAISENQRKEKVETQGDIKHFTSTISGLTSMGGIFCLAPSGWSCGKGMVRNGKIQVLKTLDQDRVLRVHGA